MGIKKLFKIKPPEEEPSSKNREELMELGIPTKNPNKKRRDKFAAYGKFAKDKAKLKVYAPPGYESYARGEEDDLNKSEVDSSEQSAAAETSEASPYEVPSGAADPYAVKPGGGVSSDPFAGFGGAVGIGSRNFSSNYDGLNASRPGAGDSYGGAGGGYGGTGGGYGGSNRAAGAGASAYNDIPASTNAYGAPRRATPDLDGRGNDASGLNDAPVDATPGPRRTTSNVDGRASNPYGRRAGGPAMNPGRGSANANAHATGGATGAAAGAVAGTAAGAAANPYSSMAHDSYSRDPLGLENTLTDNLDEDLNEGPREGEFDFEADNSNQVAVEEDLNATIEDPGDDLNAPITQQQQQELVTAPAPQQQQQQPPPQRQSEQSYEPAPQWQFEEEEVEQQLTQGQQMGESNRGYKTFEELQQEEEARQQQEEDEEVDQIKQEIRFTKQGSVASTRNTLRMAQEAEMSGMNTVGVLGHQSNQLGNVENNLDLIHSQNRIAEDRIGKLKSLNRNILAIHMSNPFNSKRRAREKADEIKNRKLEDKFLQEEKLGGVQASNKRLESAMNMKGEPLTIRDRYKRDEVLQRVKKYCFEADEEDDMMELEIDRNLDQIQQISGRLKRLALAAGDELDAQQKRLGDIEDNTDDMDIRLHLNTQRMAGIR
ncbi:related to Protein transport protein SEC9 [Zygosaccharomyces bailii ISA1307]|nr:related to Protein transport protein SEC9 [Zygosaccharomyces bailii ISA1307]